MAVHEGIGRPGKAAAAEMAARPIMEEARLSLERASMVELNTELAKGRILEAVRGHMSDLGVLDTAMFDLSFGLKF